MTKRIMWQQKDMNIIPIHTGRHVMSAIQCLTKQNTAGTAVRSQLLQQQKKRLNVSDRILVMYEGEIVGEFDPKNVTVEELGLYMAGAKRM